MELAQVKQIMEQNPFYMNLCHAKKHLKAPSLRAPAPGMGACCFTPVLRARQLCGILEAFPIERAEKNKQASKSAGLAETASERVTQKQKHIKRPGQRRSVADQYIKTVSPL